MSKTRVVYCKNEDYDVYIGRSSKWGNPFLKGINGTRAEVIKKYKWWITTQPELLEALDELDGKVLGCWCKPKACHGDVLVELIEKRKADTMLLNTIFDEEEDEHERS